MKKITSAIIIVLIITMMRALTGLAFYSDVPSEHPQYNSIKSLYELGLLPEENDNLFHPEEILRKPYLYKLILTYAKAPLSTEIDLPFTDTDNNAEYAPYLQTALDSNILNAYGPDPELGINNTVAKHNALSNMFKTLGIGQKFFFDKNNFPFTDLNPGSLIATIAAKAADLGILETEYPDKFKMAKRITRAEAADYLYKIHQYESSRPTINSTTITLTIDNSAGQDEALSTFLDIFSALKTDYYYQEEIDEDKLVYGAIQGMLDQVSDKYTVFEEPSEAVAYIDNLTGDYEGIGILIEIVDEDITIISPFKDSPAEEAGLEAKDIIIGVNEESVIGFTLEEVANRIKGPSDTTVDITILRENKELEFTVKRKFIMVNTVQHEILESGSKKIGYISIINFGEDTYQEFLDGANDLISQKADGFIIDLRNNPGGFLDVAVNMLGLFTDKIETVVILEYSDGSKDEYKTNGNGLLKDYEIVVLINKGSASASEIMAGALQDLGFAKIIGTQSFGKGSVQELRQYEDNSMFKFTISKWLTPKGYNINDKGITPDQVVENTKDQDKQLEAGLSEF